MAASGEEIERRTGLPVRLEAGGTPYCHLPCVVEFGPSA